jgi:ABC-type amino acid transport system permease subunit
MASPQNHHDARPSRLTTAAITGVLAGAARAVTEWLLHQLSSIW